MSASWWKAGNVAVVFPRLGPYHLARLTALAFIAPTTAIELSRVGNTYGWDVVEDRDSFDRVTLFEGVAVEDIGGRDALLQIVAALDRLKPSVVAIPGWSHRASLAALLWCQANGTPVVLMSESTSIDRRKYRLLEFLKQRLVAQCSTSLVGGARHQSYVRKLGMDGRRIWNGYDVVDNTHFDRGAAVVRHDTSARSRLSLPSRFFLASARFVAKKNLRFLLNAYAQYRIRAAEPWHLVLLGDGPLRDQMHTIIADLGLDDAVVLPGFRQYDQLPSYYGLAGAFIHASTTEQWGLVVNEAMAAGLPVVVSERCGCAPDLVEHGRNGFTFDPYRVDELAGRMLQLASMDESQRDRMGRASSEIISRWTPETFAVNLMKAAESALAAPRPKASLADKALLWALVHR